MNTRLYPISRTIRVKAFVMIAILVVEIAFPSVSYALTSGPSQPEFSSFEPAVTTNMVNEFSGDFTYNLPVLEVPGPDGSSYPLSLSYHSGTSPEEEASWVGYGWTLNPGAINRQKNGVPDDWNGEQVTHHNTTVPVRTISVRGMANPETFSWDIPIGLNATVRYNNYSGMSAIAGVGIRSLQGTASIGINVSNSGFSFDMEINPAALLNYRKRDVTIHTTTVSTVDGTDPVRSARKGKLDNLIVTRSEHQSNEYGSSKFLGSPRYSISGISPRTYNLEAQPGGNSTQLNFTMAVHPTIPGFEVGFQGSASLLYASQRSLSTYPMNSYGFMYGSNASASDMVDYHSESPTTFNKRDLFLPAAHHDADQFVATGEGIIGSMKLHARKPQQVRPARVESSTTIIQRGTQMNTAGTIGGGAMTNIGGDQRLEVSGGAVAPFHPITDEPFFFRMENDKGGFIDHHTGLSASQASVSLSGAPGYQNYNFSSPVTISDNFMNSGTRSGRSSHIGYSIGSDIPSMRYEKMAYVDMVSSGTNCEPIEAESNTINELSIINGEGRRYNYGIPVYSWNEKSMSYYVGIPRGQHKYKYTNHSDELNNSKFVQGYNAPSKYASTYLLTSIFSPDYVDIGKPGADDADFGSFTKFSYSKNTCSDAYQWRSPFEGYYYSDPQLGSCHDNRASFRSGDKEIYYLDRVETKSHYAVFYTSPRYDGKGKGNSPLQHKLDRIELYSKNSRKILKTVHFVYNTTIWPGSPNSSESSGGRLTLEKVYFTYNGNVEAKISPYIFNYIYPSHISYPASSQINMPNVSDETPSFNYFNSDAWGNHALNDGARSEQHQFWVDRTNNSWDRAAWQLKRIVLPSGGEIHVHYEPDDYAFVQNEKAHAMARVVSVDANHRIFYLDISELIDPTCNEQGCPAGFDREDIAEMVIKYYKNNDRPIYYKLRYNYDGDGDGQNDNLCNQESTKSEFITGYSFIDEAEIDGTLLRLELKQSEGNLPRKVCKDRYRSEKLGNTGIGPCNEGNPFGTDAFPDEPDGLNSAYGIVDQMWDVMQSGGGLVGVCPSLCLDHSWFRVPVGSGKPGGGVRVSKLLTVEPPVGGVYGSVYGNQYDYRTTDDVGRVISSGVASMEPGGLKDENVLIRPLDRLTQSFVDRAIAGKDSKQSEGPIGISAYPSPMVGYSKVVVSNIYATRLENGEIDNRTAMAHSVKEFITYKDQPILVEATDLVREQDLLPLVTGIVDIDRKSDIISQGYLIKLPSSNGALKREATYHGDHRGNLGWSNKPTVLLSSIETEYIPMADPVPVLDVNWRPGEPFGTMPLGRESDICIETRQSIDRTNDGTIEVDGQINALLIPFPSMSVLPTYHHGYSRIASHVITKKIKFPNIVKRKRIYKDGIYHTEENLAFDPSTGEPVVTRTHDGFFPDPGIAAGSVDLSTATEGVYTSVSYPASLLYTGMGQIAKGEKLTVPSNCSGSNTGVCFRVIQSQGQDLILEVSAASGSNAACEVLNAICPGDNMLIITGNGSFNYFADKVNGNQIACIKRSTLDPTLTTGAIITSFRIVRSGCNNKLTASAGAYTLYGTPLLNEMPGNVPSARQGLINNLNTTVANNANNGDVVFGFTLPANSCMPTTTIELRFLNDRLGIRDCEGDWIPLGEWPSSDNGFVIHRETGLLAFWPAGGCRPFTMDCPQFCDPAYPSTRLENVISSSATIYDDRVDMLLSGDPELDISSNPYAQGARGKWRPVSNYAFMSPLEPGTRNFDQGFYDLTLFNWAFPGANKNTPWLMTDSITKYSPHGHAWESIDALGLYSTAKYGYNQLVAYLVAKNARQDQVVFESFENSLGPATNQVFEDGGELPATALRNGTIAHAGRYSVKGNAGGSPTPLYRSRVLNTAGALANDGIRVAFWARSTTSTHTTREPELVVRLSGPDGTALPFSPTTVARTGEWVLMDVQATLPSDWSSVRAELVASDIAGSSTWIDDVRIQPTSANMTAYVYDTDLLRLLATFDDQHFGLFYQYNGEGKLVRKQVETLKGLRTVQETHYNTPHLP